MGTDTVLSLGDDPLDILGLSAEASDEEIRAAYLRKVKEYPPDRHPAEFERIRDAHELLRDPRRRADFLLLSADLERSIASLLDDMESGRQFAGPRPWLDVLKEL
ncbi:MAG: J domain-containing protein [Planctomycetota bacterium]